MKAGSYLDKVAKHGLKMSLERKNESLRVKNEALRVDHEVSGARNQLYLDGVRAKEKLTAFDLWRTICMYL